MRVKSVVINADMDWDFSRNVWLHALDTYRTANNTLFWTLEPESQGHTTSGFWGGFPEHYDRYHDALVEECGELAGSLVAHENSRLAAIVILSKADFQAFGATPHPRTAEMSIAGQSAIKAVGRLLEEVNRQSAHAQNKVSEARIRLWAAIAVRRAGDDERDGEIARQVLSRIGPPECRLNTVYLLSHGRLQDEAITADEQAFLKLRLVMELMANSEAASGKADAWRQFRRDPSAGFMVQRGVYWVKMPEASQRTAWASDSLRQILTNWSIDIDLRYDGRPNRDIKERIDNLVNELRPLDRAAIQSKLTSDVQNSTPPAAGDGESVDIEAEINAFNHATSRRWLHRKHVLDRILQAKDKFPERFQSYADYRLSAEQRQMDAKTREASVKREDALKSLRSVRVSAGEKGKREVEKPLSLLRNRLDDATARATAARATLSELLGAQAERAAARDEAFDKLAEAERQLLNPSAIRTFLILLLVFIAPSAVFNGTQLLTIRPAAASFEFLEHAFSYFYWIIVPVFGVALLIGIFSAYKLRRARNAAQSAVVSRLQEDIRRADGISAARVGVKTARDDAAILQLAIAHLAPRENWVAVNDRKYFIGDLLGHRRAHHDSGIAEVDEKQQTLQEEANRLLRQGTTDAERVQSFLAQNSFSLNGELAVTAKFLSNANLILVNRASWHARLELADPGQ